MRWFSCLRNRASLPASFLSRFLAPLVPLRWRVLPAALVLAADPLDGFAGVDVAIGVGGDVDDAQINAQELLGLDRGVLGHLHRAVEVELAAPIDEIDLALHAVESLALILAVDRAAGSSGRSSVHRLTLSSPLKPRMRLS